MVKDAKILIAKTVSKLCKKYKILILIMSSRKNKIDFQSIILNLQSYWQIKIKNITSI